MGFNENKDLVRFFFPSFKVEPLYRSENLTTPTVAVIVGSALNSEAEGIQNATKILEDNRIARSIEADSIAAAVETEEIHLISPVDSQESSTKEVVISDSNPKA